MIIGRLNGMKKVGEARENRRTRCLSTTKPIRHEKISPRTKGPQKI